MYGPVRTVVWEDGGREAPSYPIAVRKRIHALRDAALEAKTICVFLRFSASHLM